MNHPNNANPFILQTDASERALGSVLIQNDKIIAFYSKKFSATQSKWSIMEKELYAILKSLEFFRNIIYGQKISIETDNKNLLGKKWTNNKKVKRWLMLISDFEYELKHKSDPRKCDDRLLVALLNFKENENKLYDIKRGSVNFRTKIQTYYKKSKLIG